MRPIRPAGKVFTAIVVLCALSYRPGAWSPSSASDDYHGWLGTETIKTRFGKFEFKGG